MSRQRDKKQGFGHYRARVETQGISPRGGEYVEDVASRDHANRDTVALAHHDEGRIPIRWNPAASQSDASRLSTASRFRAASKRCLTRIISIVPHLSSYGARRQASLAFTAMPLGKPAHAHVLLAILRPCTSGRFACCKSNLAVSGAVCSATGAHSVPWLRRRDCEHDRSSRAVGEWHIGRWVTRPFWPTPALLSAFLTGLGCWQSAR